MDSHWTYIRPRPHVRDQYPVYPVCTQKLTHFISADACLTNDGRVLAVSNMLTGYELFAVKGLVEMDPLFCFKQDVGGRPLPVRFVHGDHALIGGALHGRVNLWDIYSRRKQVLTIGGMYLKLCPRPSDVCCSR